MTVADLNDEVELRMRELGVHDILFDSPTDTYSSNPIGFKAGSVGYFDVSVDREIPADFEVLI